MTIKEILEIIGHPIPATNVYYCSSVGWWTPETYYSSYWKLTNDGWVLKTERWADFISPDLNVASVDLMHAINTLPENIIELINRYDYSIKDIAKFQEILVENKIYLLNEEVKEIWETYSEEEYCAGWLSSRGYKDPDLLRIFKKYIPKLRSNQMLSKFEEYEHRLTILESKLNIQ